MDIVFVHGWGLDYRIWDPVASRLEGNHLIRVELGFTGLSEKFLPNDLNLQDSICVGHSLGALWLLKMMSELPRAFISINGFDRFTPHISQEEVLAMKERLIKSPTKELKRFFKASGGHFEEQNFDIQRLVEGLDWLGSWDASQEIEDLRANTCQVMALAAKDDKIVPSHMTESIWRSDEIQSKKTGGHILPLTNPEWCAEKIQKAFKTC